MPSVMSEPLDASRITSGRRSARATRGGLFDDGGDRRRQRHAGEARRRLAARLDPHHPPVARARPRSGAPRRCTVARRCRGAVRAGRGSSATLRDAGGRSDGAAEREGGRSRPARPAAARRRSTITSRSTSNRARVGAPGAGRRWWARATTRGGSSGTRTTAKRPVADGDTAVAGTIAAPWPSAARLASRRTPSISAWARSCAPTMPAARSSTRRSADPAGGSSSRWAATSASGSSAELGERVLAVGDDDEVLGEQRLDHQLRVVDGEVDDGGADAAGEQARDEHRRAALGDDRPHVRVALVEGGEQAGEQPARGRAEDARCARRR